MVKSGTCMYVTLAALAVRPCACCVTGKLARGCAVCVCGLIMATQNLKGLIFEV